MPVEKILSCLIGNTFKSFYFATMIRVGIIGNVQEEDKIYQTLHHSKDTEPVGLYNPERDTKSNRFRVFHNPVELLEVSDAVAIYNAERISADFIRLLIRKSKHIYFHSYPLLSSSEASDILKLQKEAGTSIHLYNPYLPARPGITEEVFPGVKIINLQGTLENPEISLPVGLMHALSFLNKIGNSPIKHSEIIGLPGKNGALTVSMHAICSNGSVYNVLLTGDKVIPGVCIYQKEGSLFYNISEEGNQQSYDLAAFHSFIDSVRGEKTEGVVFDDYVNSLKSFLDIKERLNYSGVGVTS